MNCDRVPEAVLADRGQDNGPTNGLDKEAIQAQIEKVLASRTFRSAQGQRAFLRFCLEELLAGRGHQLKEYTIGTQALGRPDSFNPQLDPIVRTQARKLRAKLNKYFAVEGASDELLIDFPKGAYVPVFLRRAKPLQLPVEVPAAGTAMGEEKMEP